MEVSRSYAVGQVEEFNHYFDSLTRYDQKELYSGKKATLHFYEHCFFCSGSYRDFRDSAKEDCPEGCTIGPIISRLD